MNTRVKGFVVGRGPGLYRSDGSSWSRPKLLEFEHDTREVAIAIGDEIVWLDAEAATAARDSLNGYIEAVS